MDNNRFEKSVFINCPFDEEYAPLLQAIAFCIVYIGFTPRLASERIEAGENRLDKIVEMIKSSMFSVHDLSRCKATNTNNYFRMNMPFELGVDVGFRRSGAKRLNDKKFLIFEAFRYDLQKALSDFSGQDVAHHNNDVSKAIEAVRSFFRSEANIELPGPQKLINEYSLFQGWMWVKKLNEGHSDDDIRRLPMRELIQEMEAWVALYITKAR